MSKVDWENAPSDAEACIDGCFTKWEDGKEFDYNKGRWVSGMGNWPLSRYVDSSNFRVELRPDEWKKGAERMEPIVQNGNEVEYHAELENTREHYAELENNRSKYHREIKKDVSVDVYDVLSAFEVVNPAMQHALKKMLAPGKRGAKDAIQDMQEAIQSIERAIELEKEKGE